MSSERPLALIIEDDPASAEALSLILQDWGAEVLHACDEPALAAYTHQIPNLRWIVTDFDLGAEPNGVAIVCGLTERAPDARVLVLTGSFHGRAKTAAAAAGFEVMQKPARPEIIVAWLERK
jgi:CheY-like chemotaxis protein